MCLGVPGQVVEVYREHDVLMARIDFGVPGYESPGTAYLTILISRPWRTTS